MNKKYVFAVDFDGTCVSHKYPDIGKDIGAIPVLRKIVEAGHKLILHTMRDNKPNGRHTLDEAIEWFNNNGIPLYGINKNPSQSRWTASPKIFAHYYIDDAAIGCPLVVDVTEDRPYVNWSTIEAVLKVKGIIQ